MELQDWSLIGIAASWVIAIGMVPVIVMRKEQPAICLTWLMIVFFQPELGLLLYVLLGERRLGRKRLLKRAMASAQLEASGLFGQRRELSASGRDLVTSGSVLTDLARMVGDFPIVSGNVSRFYCDALSVIDQLILDIDIAERHVHVLFYIYTLDSVGRRVTDALIRARQRGVECRVLVDDVGSWPNIRALAKEFAAHDIEFAASLPVSLLRRGLARIDLRNHRKLVIVDGTIAWTGSQNVVEDTYGHKKAGRWHDIMARITGPVVPQLQMIFLEDWLSDTGKVPPESLLFPMVEATGSIEMQVIPSGPDQDSDLLQHLLVQAIHTARQSVVLTSPYFVPDEPLLCALRLAATRGVQVHVIVPERSDLKLVDAAGAFYLGYLLRYGVRVFRFQDGLLHAKTLTVDDTFGLFGTANYDIRSFQLNFELNISLQSQVAIAELRQIQEGYREQSIEFTCADWQQLSWPRRLVINIAKLFSPLL